MPRVAARLFGEPDALADSRAADKESAMKRQAYLALSIGFIVVGVILIYPAWLSQHVSQVTFLARGIILLWLLVGVGCWVVVQLLRQNGRILLRLDALEAQLQQLGTPARTGTAAPSSSALPLGSAAPEFELKDLRGERVSLSRFRGRRVLLVFFSPQCGYCARLVPEQAQSGLAVRDSGRGAVMGDLMDEHGLIASEVAVGARQHGTENLML